MTISAIQEHVRDRRVDDASKSELSFLLCRLYDGMDYINEIIMYACMYLC